MALILLPFTTFFTGAAVLAIWRQKAWDVFYRVIVATTILGPVIAVQMMLYAPCNWPIGAQTFHIRCHAEPAQ